MMRRGVASGHRWCLLQRMAVESARAAAWRTHHMCATIRGCLALMEGLVQPADLLPLRLQELRIARRV